MSSGKSPDARQFRYIKSSSVIQKKSEWNENIKTGCLYVKKDKRWKENKNTRDKLTCVWKESAGKTAAVKSDETDVYKHT